MVGDGRRVHPGSMELRPDPSGSPPGDDPFEAGRSPTSRGASICPGHPRGRLDRGSRPFRPLSLVPTPIPVEASAGRSPGAGTPRRPSPPSVPAQGAPPTGLCHGYLAQGHTHLPVSSDREVASALLREVSRMSPERSVTDVPGHHMLSDHSGVGNPLARRPSATRFCTHFLHRVGSRRASCGDTSVSAPSGSSRSTSVRTPLPVADARGARAASLPRRS